MGSYNSKHTETELLQMLKKDDQLAFKHLYELHHQRIYQIALKYLKSSSNAQEVVQEVFMQLWVNRSTLIKIISLEAWLHTVAKNNIMNRLKREAIEWKARDFFLHQPAASEDNTFNELQNKEYTQLLKSSIENLSAQQKMVFELARYEKLSYAEIGERMQISPLTVKTHMSRALQEIRRNMAKHGIEIPVIFFFLKNIF